MSKIPKLKTVDKSNPIYPLNNFPKGFALSLGREIIYLLVTRDTPTLEGSDWEKIFASCIGAEWKPSNVGLDDVVFNNTAWGAKTIKQKKPSESSRVRLISGRNSPYYSYDESIDINKDPNDLGELILGIWNERVSTVRQNVRSLRTVVLIKSNDLTEVAVFEMETIRYDPELFSWRWNNKKNLEGIEKSTGEHRFTWQPHGSQFTIIEKVPENRLVIQIRKPPQLDKDLVLKSIDFDESWITIK